MTFLEICQTVRQECGIQGQGPSAVTNQTGMLERVVDWVIAADLVIQTMYSDWDFLHADWSDNTTVGSDELTKPSDFGMWDRESFALGRGTDDGRKLRVIDYKEWRNYQSLKISEEPYSVTILPNGNIRFYQPADDIYNITGNYWKNVTQLAEDGDVPPYPDRFHRGGVCRAKMYFYEDQEAWENFKAAEMEYQQWLNELEAFALPGQQYRSQAQPEQMVSVPT